MYYKSIGSDNKIVQERFIKKIQPAIEDMNPEYQQFLIEQIKIGNYFEFDNEQELEALYNIYNKYKDPKCDEKIPVSCMKLITIAINNKIYDGKFFTYMGNYNQMNALLELRLNGIDEEYFSDCDPDLVIAVLHSNLKKKLFDVHNKHNLKELSILLQGLMKKLSKYDCSILDHGYREISKIYVNDINKGYEYFEQFLIFLSYRIDQNTHSCGSRIVCECYEKFCLREVH